MLGVGQYNERLILQIIRRSGSLPKAEIARKTGLSAQTISVIINRLLENKLLHKQPVNRIEGKTGQPATPIALNPNGAFSVGVKIGRNSLDVVIVDFIGKVLQQVNHRYEYPDPETVFSEVDARIAELTATMGPAHRKRIVGIGVSAPFMLGGWEQLVEAPKPVLERWNSIDIRESVSENQTLPVWYSNDATAACVAELEFGSRANWNDFLYIFIGTFIGGGVVEKGVLNVGSQGNAGAIGSMPIPAVYSGEAIKAGQDSAQLIQCASRYLLNKSLKNAGFDVDQIIEELGQGDISLLPEQAVEIFEDWLQSTAQAISIAVLAALSVLDFKGVIVDGLLPKRLVERLVTSIDDAISRRNMEGLFRPELKAGVLGNDARVIGAAILPFYNSFTPDMNVLLNISGDS